VQPPDALVAAARQRLGRYLGLVPDQLMLQSASRQEWPDGALGCPQEGAVYPQVVTPGFLLIFSNQDQSKTYEVHTGEQEQQMILCENDQPIDLASPVDGTPVAPTLPSGTTQISPAARSLVELARQALAKELGVDAAAIRVVQIEEVEWRDSSLGCPKPGMNYLQVITPGYRITLEAQGRSYQYHTDTGKRVVRCDMPPTRATPAAPNPENPLANTSWQLEAFGDAGNPQPVLAGSEVTMTFSGAESVGGRSGCNSYGGKYTIDGAKITFSAIASTEMACESQKVMEQEAQFQQALLAVENYQLAGDRLELTYAGTKVLRLKAIPYNP
jgi:heat shock protein HslJ